MGRIGARVTAFRQFGGHTSGFRRKAAGHDPIEEGRRSTAMDVMIFLAAAGVALRCGRRFRALSNIPGDRRGWL
jgi:hypothetical protein